MRAIIGGTGLNQFKGFDLLEQRSISTPYGDSPALLERLGRDGQSFWFLARHGRPHKIPPHKINYRANLFALSELGVTEIVAVNAVGGIHAQLGPEKISVPDQVIDYTHSREDTFYDGSQALDLTNSMLEHVDFTFPYSQRLRESLLSFAQDAEVEVLDRGVYGATQGPRLESAAEIKRFQQDGADMVGMTGMPEAALARELNIDYACLALSVNWAAGLTDEVITMEQIYQALEGGMRKIESILGRYVSA